jgi:RNA polymerase sigma-70 factor (ECF subfamily)
MDAPNSKSASSLLSERSPSEKSLVEKPESEILERLRAGDDDAYVELVSQCGPRMLAVARRMLRDEEDAQDTVQEAFLSAFKAIAGFEGESRLSTWLHRITVNVALMRLRSRRRRPQTPIEGLLPRFIEDGHHLEAPQEWTRSAFDIAVSAQTRTWVREKIDDLPDDYRTVLILRDIEGLDTKEAAAALGITPNAAKIRLHRARLALRSLLDPLMRGNETTQ